MTHTPWADAQKVRDQINALNKAIDEAAGKGIVVEITQSAQWIHYPKLNKTVEIPVLDSRMSLPL